LYATGAALDEISQQIRTEIGALHAQISWAVEAVEAIWRITAIEMRNARRRGVGILAVFALSARLLFGGSSRSRCVDQLSRIAVPNNGKVLAFCRLDMIY